MSVLEAHRQRVATLGTALAQLEQMHAEAFALWSRIVALKAGDDEDRREQLDALHDEAFALGDRIARLREETFGSASHEFQLLVTAQVESIPRAVLHPERPPMAGE